MEGTEGAVDVGSLINLCDSDELDELTESGNEEAFRSFCRICLPAVIGRYPWKNRSTADLLSNFVTTPDEAFAVFLLENSSDKWQAMAKYGKKSIEATCIKTKYTTGTGKSVGWGNDSMDRFNELTETVAASRNVAGRRSTLEMTLRKEMMSVRGITVANGEGGLNTGKVAEQQKKRVKVYNGFLYAAP